MKSQILIGVGAGFVSSVLFVATTTMSVLSFLLLIVAPLPLFIAGLGWGAASAGIAALAGAVVIGAVFGPLQGLLFLITIGIGPVVLCRQALLSRPIANSAPNIAGDQDQGREWYPTGRLILLAAAISGGMVLITLAKIGFDLNVFLEEMRGLVEQAGQRDPSVAAAFERMDEAQRENFLAFFVRITPLLMAALWTVILTANLWLSSKVLKMSDRGHRPWAPFPEIEFPMLAVVALGASLAASLLPGGLGTAAQAFAAALVTAFAILGLAVVHQLTRDNPGRMIILATVYLSFVMFNWLMTIPFAALGVAETAFGLRARKAAGPGGPSST